MWQHLYQHQHAPTTHTMPNAEPPTPLNKPEVPLPLPPPSSTSTGSVGVAEGAGSTEELELDSSNDGRNTEELDALFSGGDEEEEIEKRDDTEDEEDSEVVSRWNGLLLLVGLAEDDCEAEEDDVEVGRGAEVELGKVVFALAEDEAAALLLLLRGEADDVATVLAFEPAIEVDEDEVVG